MNLDLTVAFLTGFSIVLLAVASIANSHRAYHATKQLESLEQRWESQQKTLWELTKDVRQLERQEHARTYQELQELARKVEEIEV